LHEGVELTAAQQREIIEFRSSLYFILEKTSTANKYLFRFDGSAFHQLLLPGIPVSDPVIFEDNLYVLIQVGRVVKLFGFDGVSLREVAFSEIPMTRTYRLFVAGQYLYLTGNGNPTAQPSTVKRFDGSRFFTLPPFGGILEIVAIPGTDRIYVNILNQRVLYFDGSVLRIIYEEDTYFYSLHVLNNVVYFLSFVDSSPVIFQHDGSNLSTLDLPEGTALAYNPLLVYRNKLMIPAVVDGSDDIIFEYDGSTFIRTFDVPGLLNNPLPFLKDGNYMIITDPRNGPRGFEYDGTTYTEIIAPAGRNLDSFLTGTSCFDLWSVAYWTSDGPLFEIAETRNCPPPPVATIPEGLRDYQRIDIAINGKYRDWCWTDIVVDWEIVPICPIPEPCPGPSFNVSLTDVMSKEIWNERFEKPFELKFPFEDIQHTLTLSSLGDNGKLEDLFILDDELVSKGLSAINISMLPQENYFRLKAETDNEDVPFMMSLLNKEGKVIWQNEFIAPLETEITATVNEPGATLKFSSIAPNQKQLEDYGITEVNFYPNPYKGKLFVDIKTKGVEVPAQVIIRNLEGQTIWDKQLKAPVQHVIEMSDQKPGLYIVTVKVGDLRISEQIKHED
jgi:hypothetical protein